MSTKTDTESLLEEMDILSEHSEKIRRKILKMIESKKVSSKILNKLRDKYFEIADKWSRYKKLLNKSKQPDKVIN